MLFLAKIDISCFLKKLDFFHFSKFFKIFFSSAAFASACKQNFFSFFDNMILQLSPAFSRDKKYLKLASVSRFKIWPF